MKQLFSFLFCIMVMNILYARAVHVIHIVNSDPDLLPIYTQIEGTLQTEVNKMAKALEAETRHYKAVGDCCFRKSYLQNMIFRTMDVHEDDVIVLFMLAHASHRSKDSTDKYPTLSFDQEDTHWNYSDLLNELLWEKKPAFIFSMGYMCNGLRGESINQKVQIQTDSLISYSKMKNPAIYQSLFRKKQNKTTVVHFFSAQVGSFTHFNDDLSGLFSPFVALNHFTNYGLNQTSTWDDILGYMAMLYASKARSNCPLVEYFTVSFDENEEDVIKEGISATLCQ